VLSFVLPPIVGVGLCVFWVVWRCSADGRHHHKLRQLEYQKREEQARQELEETYEEVL